MATITLSLSKTIISKIPRPYDFSDMSEQEIESLIATAEDLIATAEDLKARAQQALQAKRPPAPPQDSDDDEICRYALSGPEPNQFRDCSCPPCLRHRQRTAKKRKAPESPRNDDKPSKTTKTAVPPPAQEMPPYPPMTPTRTPSDADDDDDGDLIDFSNMPERHGNICVYFYLPQEPPLPGDCTCPPCLRRNVMPPLEPADC